MNISLFRILRFSGVAWFFREFVQRHKVTFLLFHDMKQQHAERNFSWLKSHYNLISLNDYLDAVAHDSSLPDKAAVITFDDGHVGNYSLLPIIEKMQIPITIFLCSGIVGTNRHFWFKHSADVIPELQRLKSFPDKERLEQLNKLGYDQLQQYNDRQALSKVEILRMAPLIDFQSHTCFHPILPSCDDLTAKDEIVNSKIQLETDYGFRIRSLSYPNGDYSIRDIEFTRQAGYECGVTVDPGYNDKNSDLFRLKRISVNDAESLDELIVKASGCYILLKRLLTHKSMTNHPKYMTKI